MTTIEAEWAVWGVSPDTGGEYAVLSHSDGRLRPRHFETIITRFSPGTPDADTALPRVTIGAVDVSKVPHLGMALQTLEPGPVREVPATRFFFFPFQAMGQARTTYLSLYEHLSRVELPASGTGPPITVDPPALDPAALAREPWEATPDPSRAAALLVRGRRLCITQAEEVPLDERLRFLDEVAAWLPYGYRARLTATTWANSATPHRLRLFFARYAGAEVTELPWSAAAPADPAGEKHQARLRATIDRLGAAEVITRLAADTAPRTFDDPGPAVRALAQMAPPFRVPDDEAGPDELRAAFAAGPLPVDEADRPAARRALVRLIGLAEPRDWPVIERWWRKFADEDASVLLTALADRCRRALWSGERTEFAHELPLAYRHGMGDEFLASLLVPPKELDEAAERAMRVAARLVHDHVLVPGATGEHPHTLRAVLEHPLLVCVFVAELSVAGRNRLNEGLLWLLSAPGGEREALLLLYDVLAGEEPTPPDCARLWWLARLGRGCLAALLEGAAAVGRLHLVLRPFGELLAAGQIPRTDFRYWAERLGVLRPAADPAVAGAIDVLLLAILAEEGPDVPAPARAAGPPRAVVEEETPSLEGADAVVHRLCMGYRRGLSLDTCARRLGTDSWTPTAAMAVAVVRGLASALVEHGAPPTTAQEWSVGLARRLASGDFGRKLARRFRRELLTAVTADLRDRMALLDAVVYEGPALVGTHRQELQALHADLGRLLAWPSSEG